MDEEYLEELIKSKLKKKISAFFFSSVLPVLVVIILIICIISAVISFLFGGAVDTEYIDIQRLWEGLDFSYYSSERADNRWWYIGVDEETGEDTWYSFADEMEKDSTGNTQLDKTLLAAQFSKKNLLFFHDKYFENNCARYFKKDRYKTAVQLYGMDDGTGTKFKNPYSEPYKIDISSQLIGEFIYPPSYEGEKSESFSSDALTELATKMSLELPGGYIRKYGKIPVSAMNNVGLSNIERFGMFSSSNRLDKTAVMLEKIGDANSLYLHQDSISDYSSIKEYNFPWQGLFTLYLMSDYHEDYMGDVGSMSHDKVITLIDQRNGVITEEDDNYIENAPIGNSNYVKFKVDDGLLDHTDEEKVEFIDKLTDLFIPKVTFKTKITDYIQYYTAVQGTSGENTLYKVDYNDTYPYPTKNYAALNSLYNLTDEQGNFIKGQAAYRYLLYNMPTSVVSKAECWFGTYEFEFDDEARTITKVKKTIDMPLFEKTCEDLLTVTVNNEGEEEKTFTEFDMSEYLDYISQMGNEKGATDETKKFSDTIQYYYGKSQKEAYYEENDYLGSTSLGTKPIESSNPQNLPSNIGVYVPFNFSALSDQFTGKLSPENLSSSPEYYTFSGNVLSAEQINDILSNVTNSDIALNAIYFAAKRVGCAYSQASRNGPNSYDCSSLAYYSYKMAGVTMGASTAATEAKWLADNGLAFYDASQLQPGDLAFYDYGAGIAHVVIYVGNGKIIEASGDDKGVLYGNFYSNNLVMFGRPRNPG